MVSGTPFIASLDDLHGELQFLQVWPFSLRLDGFWERKVSGPWAQRDPACLPLLHLLLASTTMRHTKSQRTLAGAPLVQLPALTVHYVPIIPATYVRQARQTGPLAAHASQRLSMIMTAWDTKTII
jgi:hypothetical protein